MVICFKKVKIISEETSLNNNFSKFILKHFCLISIRSEQESKICSNERGSRRHTKVEPPPSTRINELHVSDQYVNEKEQSLLVWLKNEIECDQSIWSNSV